MMSDLQRDTKLLAELVIDLDADARGGLELDDALECFAAIEQANRTLADTRRYLADQLGDLMQAKRRTVIDAGTFERTPRREGSGRKCMDPDGLWRTVLDSRVVDDATGEIMPQAEVIRRVYGTTSRETGETHLAGASPMKLEALGIDADAFFDEPAPRVGWTLRVT